MFEYAKELPLRGQTVLMANADAAVGDATVLKLASGLHTGRVLVFGGRRPTGRAARVYETLATKLRESTWQYPCESSMTDGYRSRDRSIDGYLWRRPLQGGALSAAILPDNLKMNALGAESHAVLALVQSNATDLTADGALFNGCRLNPAPLMLFHQAASHQVNKTHRSTRFPNFGPADWRREFSQPFPRDRRPCCSNGNPYKDPPLRSAFCSTVALCTSPSTSSCEDSEPLRNCDPSGVTPPKLRGFYLCGCKGATAWHGA